MKPIRLTLICDLSLQKQANQELASMLGDDWANTFETIVESKKDASKKAFAGWQGPEGQAEKVRLVCEVLGIECYETKPEGVELDDEKEEIILSKEEQPREGKKGLYLQELVLEDFKPEAIR